jgi:hypothetical protein
VFAARSGELFTGLMPYKLTTKVMSSKFSFQNDSEFERAYEDLVTSQDFQRLQNKYTVKPYYFKFKDLNRFLGGFTWFIQAVTIAVSFMAIIGLLAPMMPYKVAVCFALVSLVCIEVLKRLTFKPSVKEFLQFKKFSVFQILIALAMLGVSLWLTWNGTHKAVFELTAAPALVNVDSTISYEKDRIKQINADIAQAQKIRWQGKITEKGQKIIDRLTSERGKIQDKLDSKESSTTAKNEQTAADHQAKTTTNATHFKYLTLCLDLLLFALLAWLEYYDYRSIAEFSELKAATAAVKQQTFHGKSDATANVKQQAFNSNPPTFSENSKRVVIKGFLPNAVKQQPLNDSRARTCEHCGSEYIYKIHNQRFCGESCRIAAWEARTGKKFKKPKVTA